ncbi:MAG: hypothetical protein ACRDUY_03830 [Nitriliruptorales bacterium]
MPALVRAREAVDANWVARRRQGHEPDENEQTNTLLRAGHPEVLYQQLKPHEEGKIGADWLWWFVDNSGECFGLLVQAKKLTRTDRGWALDVAYESGDELQIHKLLRAADHFQVPAAYVLYAGDGEYRNGLTCGRAHEVVDCGTCARAGVSILAALCVNSYLTMQYTAEEVFASAMPLEDLVRDDGGQLRDLNLRTVTPELRMFLLMEQDGARRVAKELLRQISNLRTGQLGAVAEETVDLGAEPIFTELPADRGHLSRPYFPHVLQGLRHALPSPVSALLTEDDPAAVLEFEGLDGVALFRV